ncbi:uncharacterized protein LOC108831158 [Raphanus sativus]|uniref:Uncharacterized protein LOC108831158 n=1 Tax=Raphanus sativus TaxID=3726 RepID=A0A6J0LLI6_RAPSA|nr:uncharacterized protein LOC108831158 [Raphanus sativus]
MRRKKAIEKAKQQRLLFLQILTTIFVVEVNSDDRGGSFHRLVPTMSNISIKETTFLCDAAVQKKLQRNNFYKVCLQRTELYSFLSNYLANLLFFYWRFRISLRFMADGIRRAMQDIDLGFNNAPFVLPAEVVRQAAEENSFILIGRPVMPRRQNLRAIVATMPRNWGFEGIVRGRVTEGRRFQFVFPSEEALETVLRRGPWAYAERMLVLQRWTPLMDMELLNFIPFWIQDRGIPFQYMNREVIVNIARLMGQYIQMDYNEEVGGRQEFVRIRLNWNVAHPVCFQQHFRFTLGVNTLLRFRFERLRGFCEECGMLTHDSGACIINNGGMEQGGGDDDGDNDQDDDAPAPNHGVIIEEIHEEEAMEEEVVADPVQKEYGNTEVMETEADDEEL